MALLTISLRIVDPFMYRSRRKCLCLVYDRPTADVEGCCGHGACQIGCGEGGHIAHIFERRCLPQHRLPDDHVGDDLLPSKLSGIVSSTPPVCSVTARIPCLPSSEANWRRNDSMAPRATWKPPM